MIVSLHGAYFGLNFGDTLLCRLFCTWLRQAGATHVNLPLASETNRRLVGADSIGLATFAKAEAVLFCGGGYFSESHRRPIVWTVRHLMRFDSIFQAARLANKPYAIMGVGAGPLTNLLARVLAKSAFAGARDTAVRDVESRDFLAGIGVSRALTVAPDAVALCSADQLLGHARRTSTGRRIFLHVPPNPNAQDIAVANAVLDFAALDPQISVMIKNDYHSEKGGDCPAWPDGIVSRAAASPATIEFSHYDGEPASLLAALDACDLVITPKLHVGIAATVLEKFVIAIPFHSKTRRYYREIGQSAHCLSPDGDWRTPLAALLQRWHDGDTPDWSKRRQLQDSFSYQTRISEFLAAV